MPHSAWIGVASLAFAILLQTAVLSFWLGRLSQRVLTVEKSVDGREDMADKVTRLTVEMEHANVTLAKLVNNSENVNRQLGNLSMGQLGRRVEINP